MNAADLRSARAALDVARPAVVRLDVEHAPEHAAADLRDAWAATETALRASIGGSGLSGPALVGEARTRGVLEYPHAHALLAFQSAADRAAFPEYRATVDDVASARAGFQALEAALGLGIAADTGMHGAVSRQVTAAGQPASPFAPPAPGYTPPPVTRPTPSTAASATRAATGATTGAESGSYNAVPPTPTTAIDGMSRTDRAPRAGRNRTAGIIGAVIALAIVAAGLYWLFAGNRTHALEQAVAEYKAGQREAARRDFQKAAEANSGAALPHVYLARMAREDGDLPRASTELETATRVEPGNALAQREVGLLLIQTNHPDRAIEYLRTAVQADPTDRVAMGWLGCALVRVNNAALAQSFFQRAGSGDWSACRPDASGGAAPAGAPATTSTAPAASTVPGPSYPAATSPAAANPAPTGRP